MDLPWTERNPWKWKENEEISSSDVDDFTSYGTPGTPDSLPYLIGNREEYLNLGIPLFEASIMGDWETAKRIFDVRRDLVGFGLSKNIGTALHVVATTEETKQTLNFVKNLVNFMTREELELKNKHSNTAFWIASASGKVKMAKIMMEKNSDLLNIRGSKSLLPLSASAISGEYHSVRYLYDNSHMMSDHHWTDGDRDLVLLRCVDRDMFDVAIQILKDCPELARNVSLLNFLAAKPYAFKRVEKNLIIRIIIATVRFFLMKVQPAAEENTDALKLLKFIWGNALRTMNLDEIDDMLRGPPTRLGYGAIGYGTRSYHSRILFVAAERGNTEFIAELLRTYPDGILDKNDNGHTIFHIAVMHRHQGIYNLLYEIGSSKDDVCIIKDNNGNNMLHLVGLTSKNIASKASGASLLMQREVLWLKEVEAMMPPYMREQKNRAGQTPYELFSKENKELVSKGLDWMKDCMVVATLIITVAFAVAFTIPSGYNQEHGLPVFIHQRTFLVFVISDAVSLFSSSTSLLVFLSILTSRHDQRDFLYSLPRKLMIGLLTLFISVAAMMVTFSASFFVLYHKGLKWVPILIAAFAVVPIFVFAILQFPLWVDMFRSMYDSRYLFNPKKHMLYIKKRKVIF